MMIRLAGRILSPRGKRARLVILTYHRVLNDQDPLQPDAVDRNEFECHLRVLSRDFTPLHLSDAVVRLQNGTLPSRAVAVTFDDGYRDNFEVALPCLEKYGVPATFFVAAGFLDGGIMWNDMIIESIRSVKSTELDLAHIGLGIHAIADDSDRIRVIENLIGQLKYAPVPVRQELVSETAVAAGQPLPEDMMMSSAQVLGLSGRGMEVGGHTLSHPILSRLDAAEAEAEILEGRKRLEEITGRRIRTFAYPNGRPGRDYRREHVDILLRNGFACAVTTSWGCATSGSDAMQLPRIAPWDRTASRFAVRVLLAYRQDQAEYL